jgi:hypothetical protein
MDASCGALPQFGGDLGLRVPAVRHSSRSPRALPGNLPNVGTGPGDCFAARATAVGFAGIALCRLRVLA